MFFKITVKWDENMSNFILKNKYKFSRNGFCKEKENFAFWEMRGTFLLTEITYDGNLETLSREK